MDVYPSIKRDMASAAIAKPIVKSNLLYHNIDKKLVIYVTIIMCQEVIKNKGLKPQQQSGHGQCPKEEQDWLEVTHTFINLLGAPKARKWKNF